VVAVEEIVVSGGSIVHFVAMVTTFKAKETFFETSEFDRVTKNPQR